MNPKEDVCQINIINEKKVEAVGKEMLEDDVYSDLSETFSALGNITRVKILHILSRDELCVCDISAILAMSISAVSHQLRILRNMKIVKFRKDGKIVYYSLDDGHIVQLLKIAREHIME
ncbi:MAG: helix-turn-helix transcriptional regulator [Thermoplasmata archaeon]|nr:helix-turn-helix transcriptional regulator [Thermoplasmata archaeon]